MPEDKDVVEKDVGDGHQNCRCSKNAGLRDSYVKTPENGIDKCKEIAVNSPVEVGEGCIVNLRRADSIFHDKRHAFERKYKNEYAQQKIKYQCIVENGTNLCEIFFTVSSSNQNLSSLTETKANHENGKVKHTANGRCTQFHFANPPKKGRIGDINNVLRNQRQKNGVGYFEYVFIGSHEILFYYVGLIS